MDRPAALGQQLALALVAGVRVPELGLEDEPAGRRRAAGVRDRRRVLARVRGRLARARGDVRERLREREERRARALGGGEQHGGRDESERGSHMQGRAGGRGRRRARPPR